MRDVEVRYEIVEEGIDEDILLTDMLGRFVEGQSRFGHLIHYPLNVAGKPLASWPSYIPITFELTILFAAFAAVFGMIAMNGLPMPYHPIFNASRFALAPGDVAVTGTGP